MISWSSSIKICFYKLIEKLIKKICHGVKQNAKIVQLVKEVFTSGRQILDQKRKKGWRRGRRERIEQGSRERIEIERKETKGNLGNNLKRRIRNIDTCLCLLFSFLKALCFSKFPRQKDNLKRWRA